MGNFSAEFPSKWGWHKDFFPLCLFFFSFKLNILQLWGHPQLTVKSQIVWKGPKKKMSLLVTSFANLGFSRAVSSVLCCFFLFLTNEAGTEGRQQWCSLLPVLPALPSWAVPLPRVSVSLSPLGLSQRGQAQRTQQMEAEVLTRYSWGLSPKHQALH